MIENDFYWEFRYRVETKHGPNIRVFFTSTSASTSDTDTEKCV